MIYSLLVFFSNFFYISLILINNIGVLMSLAKIPMQKTVYGVPFFNGTYFTIVTIFFIAFFAFMHIKDIIFFMQKKASLHVIIILFIIIFSYFQFEYKSIHVRAEELMTISLTDEIIAKKQLSPDQMQIGFPILTSFFTSVFKTSIDFGSNMVIGILLISFLIQIIALINTMISKKRFFQISNFHSSNTNQFFSLNIEQIVTANIFLFLGVVNIWWFKILLGITIVYIVTLLFTKKRDHVLFFVKTLILMVCINPLLVGFIFRL